jgi:NitT/TauT family transport system substrate-binding protein
MRMRTGARRRAFAALLAIAGLAAAGAAPLKVGVLPDADSLPLLVAREEGLFAAEGVDVALVPFKAAVERDAALQAGAVDGAVTDLLAVALANAGGFELRASSLTDGRYGLVACPGSGAASPAELAGKSIGISSNTIIQYAAETMLARAGVGRRDIRTLAVPNIQLRMELLLAGKLDAACLPEPLLSAARAKGAILVAASDDQGLRAGVLAFPKAAIDARLPEIAAFYRAYRKAASRIAAAPDSYRGFLVEKALFPAAVRDGFVFPAYRSPRLPSEADVASVLEWMGAKGLLDAGRSGIVAADLVDARPLAEAQAGW